MDMAWARPVVCVSGCLLDMGRLCTFFTRAAENVISLKLLLDDAIIKLARIAEKCGEKLYQDPVVYFLQNLRPKDS